MEAGARSARLRSLTVSPALFEWFAYAAVAALFLIVVSGATVRLTETLNVAGVGYNLWGEDSVQFPRAAAAGLSLRPLPQLTATVDAVWTLDNDADTKTGRYGGGLEYFATGKNGQLGYPLRAGVVHDNEEGFFCRRRGEPRRVVLRKRIGCQRIEIILIEHTAIRMLPAAAM